MLAALAVATTIAIDAPPPPDTAATSIASSADAPRDIVLGIVSLDVLVSERGGEHHVGGRIGVDMLGASGRGATRVAGGIRLLLGAASGFGPEGQLQLGVAHALHDRAVVALVAPVGFTFSGPDLSARGYVGLAGIAALGQRGRSGGFERFGVELAAELSNRGPRARLGVARGGKDVGFGIGVMWQRDGDSELFGLYLAETAGR